MLVISRHESSQCSALFPGRHGRYDKEISTVLIFPAPADCRRRPTQKTTLQTADQSEHPAHTASSQGGMQEMGFACQLVSVEKADHCFRLDPPHFVAALVMFAQTANAF